VSRSIFEACFSRITVQALRLASNNYIRAEKPLKPCTGVFTTTTGLPCAHIIDDKRLIGLLPTHFHPHWYWDRYPSLDSPLVLEPPAKIRRVYVPPSGTADKGPKRSTQNSQGSQSRSTRRIPSGFEATEERVRRCGLCRQPGHTRASLQCPRSILNTMQELNIQPDLTLNPATQFIPRSTIEAILDSSQAGQSALKLALQSLLDSGVELIPKSTL
jgi:hypothetical protein